MTKKSEETEQKTFRLLLVDDDNEFRKISRESLEMKNFKVLEASNGQEALSILGIEHVDVILSDIRMPKLHGIDLLHRVKKEIGNVPVILMTGFSDLIEVKEAYEIGASGFLNKPFNVEDLDRIFHEIFGQTYKERQDQDQGPSQEKQGKKEGDDFCQILIDEFISGSQISYPIFLKLSENKFVKLANKGEDLSSNMLEKLKKKGITCLYLKNEDFKKYLKFNTDLGKAISRSRKVDSKKKTKFFNQTFKQIVKFGHDQFVDEEVFNFAKKNLEMTVDMYSNSAACADLLEDLMNAPGDHYGHAVSVSMLSSMIARGMGWSSTEKLFLVSMAGLFHDIGKKDLDPGILEKEPEELEEEERAEYEKHPEVGAEIIKNLGVFPEGMDQIVLHHHESVDGAGFPNGFGRVKIHPVAKIINLADRFVLINARLQEKRSKVNPADVIAILEESKSEFENEHFNSLRQLFHLGEKVKKGLVS